MKVVGDHVQPRKWRSAAASLSLGSVRGGIWLKGWLPPSSISACARKPGLAWSLVPFICSEARSLKAAAVWMPAPFQHLPLLRGRQCVAGLYTEIMLEFTDAVLVSRSVSPHLAAAMMVRWRF